MDDSARQDRTDRDVLPPDFLCGVDACPVRRPSPIRNMPRQEDYIFPASLAI